MTTGTSTTLTAATVPGNADDTTLAWLQEVYTAVDGRDAKGFASFFADDATLTWANEPTVQGADAIAQVIDGFFQTIAGLTHRYAHVWTAEDTVVFESTVTYERLDGDEVTVPATTVLERTNEDEIDAARIYVDLAPLFA